VSPWAQGIATTLLLSRLFCGTRSLLTNALIQPVSKTTDFFTGIPSTLPETCNPSVHTAGTFLTSI